MKKHEINQIIKQEIESHIPTHAPKMDWDMIENLRNQESEKLIKPRQSIFNLRLVMNFALTMMLIIGVWIIIDGYGSQTAEIPSGQDIFLAEENVLPLSFLSTAVLLPAQMPMSSNQSILLSNETSMIDLVKPFLGMIETLISQSEGPVVEVKTSDIEGYDTWVIIHAFDLLAKPMTFEMHYRVVSYDEKEGESLFRIEGLMINRNVSYPMIGTKEVEDGEEKIVVIGKIDEDNYVETTFMQEQEESSYHIQVVKQGQLDYESKMKVEQETTELKVELEILKQQESAYYEFKYELEEDKPLLKVEFEIINENAIENMTGEMKIFVIINQVDQTTSYQFIVKTKDSEYNEYSKRDLKNDEDEDDEQEEDEQEEDEQEEDEENNPEED